MTLPRKLLIDDEHIIASTRTHVKVLLVPFLIMLVVSAATGFLMKSVGEAGGGNIKWGVLALGLALIAYGSVLPWLRWVTWAYTLTNKRLVERKGILSRSGRIIPLTRINDVSFEKELIDRMLGCGTLIVHNANEQAGLRLRDIPRIEDFHRTVSNLVLSPDNSARHESL